jgi:hypothetical protein
MENNMMELNLNELDTVSAGMTREERQKVLAPKDDDNICTAITKKVFRGITDGIDTIGDAITPSGADSLNPDHIVDTAKGAYRRAWKWVCGWFN